MILSSEHSSVNRLVTAAEASLFSWRSHQPTGGEEHRLVSPLLAFATFPAKILFFSSYGYAFFFSGMQFNNLKTIQVLQMVAHMYLTRA